MLDRQKSDFCHKNEVNGPIPFRPTQMSKDIESESDGGIAAFFIRGILKKNPGMTLEEIERKGVKDSNGDQGSILRIKEAVEKIRQEISQEDNL